MCNGENKPRRFFSGFLYIYKAKKEKSRENEEIRRVLVMWSGEKKGFS